MNTADRLADALRSLLSLCVAECDGVWEGDGAWEEAKAAREALASYDTERQAVPSLAAAIEWQRQAVPLLRAAVSWMPSRKCAMSIREIESLLARAAEPRA